MKVEKDYYGNGRLAFEFPYQDGKRHGICKCWYTSGQLQYERPYQNGELHGIYRYWYENGQLLYEYYWLYGNRVSKEEYRRHQLITQLAGISDGS